jgi:hypothetical protein
MQAGVTRFLAEASELNTHVVFQVVDIRKTAFSESILQGAKHMEVVVC